MMANFDHTPLSAITSVKLAPKDSNRALSRLFKNELHPRRIVVIKTRYTQGTFRLLLESVERVEPDEIFQHLRSVLSKANIKSIKRLKVYTRRIGCEQVEWIRVLDLRAQNQLQLIESPQAIEAINFLKKVEFPSRKATVPC
ncbi:MAG: hypothetical protein HC838_16530 [Spirulinaceae cyanobacterium RM2_2_10]|nr:hypothetical protein [Spirulinaceae cyanobacterium RM2_2_10]